MLVLVLTKLIGWGIFVLSLACMIFILVVILYYLLRRHENKNDATEKEIIWSLLCDKIKSDVAKYGEGIKVVRDKYQIDCKGSYGEIVGKWLMVLLSNNQVLEYKVEYRNSEREIPFYEVSLEPTESTDPAHLKAIQQQRLINSIKKLLEKVPPAVWILSLMFFGIFGLGVLLFGIYLVATCQWCPLIWSAVYFILLFSVDHFTKNKRKKVIKLLKSIISIPFIILYYSMKFAYPTLVIVIGFFFYDAFHCSYFSA
jgi:hypothetical protein